MTVGVRVALPAASGTAAPSEVATPVASEVRTNWTLPVGASVLAAAEATAAV